MVSRSDGSSVANGILIIGLMYNKNTKQDPIVAAVTAALGAGVATSFAVSQGQSPWLALGITIFAAALALILDRLGVV